MPESAYPRWQDNDDDLWKQREPAIQNLLHDWVLWRATKRRGGTILSYFQEAQGHRAVGDKTVSGADTDRPSIFYQRFPRSQSGGGGAVVNPDWTRLRFAERQTTISSHT